MIAAAEAAHVAREALYEFEGVLLMEALVEEGYM
jgi:hypothetical protein